MTLRLKTGTEDILWDFYKNRKSENWFNFHPLIDKNSKTITLPRTSFCFFVKHMTGYFNPIPPCLFLEPVTPWGGFIDPPSNFKTTKPIEKKLWPKMDNYKKFQFDLFLENFITLFVFYDVIKFWTIETLVNCYFNI